MRARLDDVLARVDDADAVRASLAQLHAALDERRDATACRTGTRVSSSWIRRLWPFLARHKRKVFIAFGVSLGTTLITVLIPLIERAVVDNVIVEENRALWPLLALLVGLGAVNFGLSYTRRFVGGRFAFDVQHDLRTTIFERVQRLDFAHHDQLPTGQIVSRASSDLALVQALLSFLPLATGNVVLLVLSLVVMLFLSPLLTLVVLATVPALLFVSLRLRRVMFPAQWDSLQRAGEVAGVVDEAVSGVRVVKGFGQEDRELARLTDAAEGLYRSRVRTVRLQARYQSALQAIPALGQVGVLALGGWLAIQGEISIGTFLAFSTYLVQLLAPVRMFAGMVAVAEQARAGTERIFELIDSNPLVTERAGRWAARGDPRRDRVRPRHLRVPPLGARAARLLAAGRAGRDGRAGRRFGVGQVDGQPAAPPLLRRAGRHHPHRRHRRPRRHPRLDPPRDRHRVRGRVPLLRHRARQHRLRTPRRGGRRRRARRLASRARTSSSRRCRGATTPSSANGASRSPAVSGSASPSPVPSSPIRASSCSTTPPRRSTRGPRSRSTPRLREIMVDRTTVLIAHRRSTLRLADRIVLMDGGRAVETGTHEELLAGSSRYRALLQGPARISTAPATTARARCPACDHAVAVGPDRRVGSGTRVRGPGRIGPRSRAAASAGSGASARGAGGGIALGAHPGAARGGRRAASGRRRPRRRRRRRGRRERALPVAGVPASVPPPFADRLRSDRRRHAAHPGRSVPRAAGSQRRRAGSRRPARSGSRRCSSSARPSSTGS